MDPRLKPLEQNSAPIARTYHLQKVMNNSTPSEPTIDRNVLYNSYNLIVEELAELAEIIEGFDDLSEEERVNEVSDVSIDLMEFIQQMMIGTGTHKRYMEDSYKIYKNNLTKVCMTDLAAQGTVDMYREKGEECRIEDMNGYYVIKRVSDGKYMKPVGFQPVEL